MTETLVLVEGASDRLAVETLASRFGLDLAARGVRVVELAGATNVGRFLRESPAGARLLGLYDDAEERFFRRGLERAGHGVVPDRAELERRGFFACVADLEDELVRALGGPRVVEVIAEQGELTSLRILQNQPFQRDRDEHDQLRHFLGTRSGRKSVYARALVEALDLGAVPAPLAALLSRV